MSIKIIKSKNTGSFDVRGAIKWENLLEEISEETMYLFQNIFLKVFNGLKLAATRTTIVSSEGPVSFTPPKDAVTTTYMELKKQLKNRLHPKICCPEVISVILGVFPGCTNISCGTPVVVIPDQPPLHASCTMRR